MHRILEKYCPDYEIRCWNERNYDVTKNQYMYEAYKAKKWGFVPDFARLDIIYTYGGIYLDTDVELIRNLDDLLANEAFMGFEEGKHISPGLGFGAVPHHKGIKKLLQIYDSLHFANEDGTFNLTPSPVMNTNFLIVQGAQMNDQLQHVLGITIYPSDYFCPMSYTTGLITLTPRTYSIHRYSMSWVDPNVKKWHQREQLLSRRVHPELAKKLIRGISFPDRVWYKIKTLGMGETCKFILRKLRGNEK